MKFGFFAQAAYVYYRHVKIAASHEWEQVDPVIVSDAKPHLGMTANNPSNQRGQPYSTPT